LVSVLLFPDLAFSLVSTTKITPRPPYSITTVYLETLEQSIRDVSTSGDDECFDQMRVRVFKRLDFLRFDVRSIGSHGNDTLFQMLNPTKTNKPCNLPGNLEMEFWDQWKQYPNFDKVQDLTKGKALALLAWLCQTFGLRLYYSRLSESNKKSVLKKDNEDNILDYLTLDGFVFLFVQVKNNINKWNLMYSAWKGNTFRAGWKTSALGQVIKELAEASRAVKRANGENLDDRHQR
jgi:hypothetical protein